MGRAVAMGSLVGVIVSLIGVTAVMLALDVEPGSAFGLGVFVAFWGGLGFGTMVGGVFWANDLEHQGASAVASESTAVDDTVGDHPVPAAEAVAS